MKRHLLFIALAFLLMPIASTSVCLAEDRPDPNVWATRIYAEKGDAESQYYLGYLYADGYGVEQDYIAHTGHH